MREVRRSVDDELCGHVDEVDGRWRARTVFGAELGAHGTEAEAERQVLAEGLASLADRWTLRNTVTGEDEIVCLLEARDGSVTLSVGYYPGPPSMTLTRADLAAGPWSLAR
ncbi:MAG: hypothetical protein ACTHN0_18355 [Aquihabitans sp.]